MSHHMLLWWQSGGSNLWMRCSSLQVYRACVLSDLLIASIFLSSFSLWGTVGKPTRMNSNLLTSVTAGLGSVTVPGTFHSCCDQIPDRTAPGEKFCFPHSSEASGHSGRSHREKPGSREQGKQVLGLITLLFSQGTTLLKRSLPCPSSPLAAPTRAHQHL